MDGRGLPELPAQTSVPTVPPPHGWPINPLVPAVSALKALPTVPHTVPMLEIVPAVRQVEAATFSGAGAPPGELPPASGVTADLSPASMVEEASPLEPGHANVE